MPLLRIKSLHPNEPDIRTNGLLQSRTRFGEAFCSGAALFLDGRRISKAVCSGAALFWRGPGVNRRAEAGLHGRQQNSRIRALARPGELLG